MRHGRRRIRKLALLCAACAGLALAPTASSGRAPPELPTSTAAARMAAPGAPNVVVILVDDLGWPDVSTYGRTTVKTPNIDRIARTGVGFSNGYVAASVCAVSRAAILTGRSPQTFGFQYNLDDKQDHERGLPLTEPSADGAQKALLTIADRLKALGYHTGAIGKWHQGFTSSYYPTRRGFDEFFGFLAGETIYVDPKAPGMVTTPTPADHYPLTQRSAVGQIVEGPDARPVDDFQKYLTTELTDQAVGYIDRNAARKQPFFLYLAYNAPHWPMQAPQAYYDRFGDIKDPVRRTYVAMIAALDDGVGRVLDELDRQGVRDNTLIVFLSDNGCPAQFGSCDCSHPLGAGKFSYIEGGTRVPFMMSWPRRLKPKGIVDTPVSSLDILPTVLSAASLRTPQPGLEGQDLLRAASGSNAAREPRTLFWGQAPLFAAVRGQWKLWKSDDQKRTALFDLKADPWETTDVSGQHPDVVRALDAQLQRWRAGFAPPLWPRHAVRTQQICGRPTETIY